LVVDVVSILAWIVAIGPRRAIFDVELLLDVVPVVPFVGILCLDFGKWLLVDRRCTFARVERIGAVDRDAETNEPARMLFQELSDIQAVAIPRRQIRCIERNGLAPKSAPDAAELVGAS